MKRGRKILSVIPMLIICMGICASAAEGDGMVTSFLTGKEVPESIGRTRAVSIMLSNSMDALPQSGISAADIIYEAPVEGSLTRLMGIFEDYQDVERIGSVRSCREYYVDFAREFDSIYLHYGEAVYAVDLLNLPDTLRLSGMEDVGLEYDGEGDVTYYRSSDFPSPHNVFTNYNMIQDGITYKEYSRDYSDAYLETGHYRFAADGEEITLDDGMDAYKVTPGSYVYSWPYFLYNPDTGLYTRYQFDSPQIDGNNGEELTYDNILIEFCPWEKLDDNGYLDIDVVSGGDGLYITRGKAIDISWSKDDADHDDPSYAGNFGVTHYYDADGEEITLNQGKTWVCIVLDSDRDTVTLSPDEE